MFKIDPIANRGKIACRIIRTVRALGIFAVLIFSIPPIPAQACAWADGPPSTSLLNLPDVIVVEGEATLDPANGRGLVKVQKLIRGNKLVSNVLEFSSYDADFDTMGCGPWKWTTNKSTLVGLFYLKSIKGTSRYLIYEFKSEK